MKNPVSPWTILTLVLLLAAPAYLALSWPQLPAQIPTHFNSAGQPNGYTAKENMWLLCVALPAGLFLLLTVLPFLDPKKRLDGSSVNFLKLRLALVGLLSGLSMYSLYVGLHPTAAAGSGLTILLGIVFVFMGNYLTTVQPNYFVGVRTPWTLESPVVWSRTHRLVGRLFFLAGLAGIIMAFTLRTELANEVLVGLILGAAAVAWVYSYLVFRQEEKLANAS